IFRELGNRGYRVAQLEAAIEGGKAYLAAYAVGLGATGLTFFDDDVTRFFSPHAAGRSVMFLVGCGRPRRRLPCRAPGAWASTEVDGTPLAPHGGTLAQQRARDD